MNSSSRSPLDERDVAVLMRVAGKRHAVSPERYGRVRDAARAEWQAVAARRLSRRRRAVAAAVAAAAVLVVAFALRYAPFGPDLPRADGASARVAAVVGDVWLDEAGDGRPPTRGATIEVGTTFGTGADGRIGLVLPSGHAIRLDHGARARWLEPTVIALDTGAVYVDSGIDRDPAAAVEVRTPFGVVQEIGTQFEVRLEPDAIRLRLREGAARLVHEGRALDVVAGAELLLAADGTIARAAIAPDAPDWSWALGVATVPPLEGRTAREFLEWAARERGLALRFDDAALARSADAIVLGGTAEGLTVDEALAAVLPTCRLSHHVENGVLHVSAER